MQSGIVGFAQSIVVLEKSPEGGEGEHHASMFRPFAQTDVEDEAVFLDAQNQVIGTAAGPSGLEVVLPQKVVDRDFAFLLDLWGSSRQRLVIEGNAIDAKIRVLFGRERHRSARAIQTNGDRAAMRTQTFRFREF